MPKWIFEPGHSAAGFRARHMMVSWVRGDFKDVHGSLEFDADNPAELSLEAIIETSNLWTGEMQRDEHLRGSDFLDVEKHSMITFRSTASKCVGAADFEVSGNLTIRGISRPVAVWTMAFPTVPIITGPTPRASGPWPSISPMGCA